MKNEQWKWNNKDTKNLLSLNQTIVDKLDYDRWVRIESGVQVLHLCEGM